MGLFILMMIVSNTLYLKLFVVKTVEVYTQLFKIILGSHYVNVGVVVVKGITWPSHLMFLLILYNRQPIKICGGGGGFKFAPIPK